MDHGTPSFGGGFQGGTFAVTGADQVSLWTALFALL
jgi:hypothetical protein